MKNKPEKFALRVIKGGFEIADEYTRGRLREKGFSVGDIVFAQISKPRNPRFHAYAHQFGKMIVDNIEEFQGLTAHQALKRLQYESGVACEEMDVKIPELGECRVRQPISLSFESMDEGEFRDTIRGLARHVVSEYWPTITAEQIEKMAGMMPHE